LKTIRINIPKSYAALAIALMALCLHYYTYGNGLLLTDDSRHYLAAANSFGNHFSLIDNDGHYFLFWPPLFPVLLSFFNSIHPIFIWIHLILLITAAYFLYRLVSRCIQRPVFFILCYIHILLGVHLLLISTFLWSELLFLCLLLVFVDQVMISDRTKYALYFAMLTGFLMCLQRNAGFFIVLGASVWMFMYEKNAYTRWIKPIGFAMVICSGWFIWNIFVWYFIPHEHFVLSIDLFKNIAGNINTFSVALVGLLIPISQYTFYLLLIIAFTILYLYIRFVKSNPSIQLISIIVIIYLFLLYLVLTVNIAGFPVDFGEADRFIAVIVPLLSILFFKVLEEIYARLPRKFGVALLLLVSLWMLYPISRTIKNARQWHIISYEKTGH
jgi:hypothetical protein